MEKIGTTPSRSRSAKPLKKIAMPVPGPVKPEPVYRELTEDEERLLHQIRDTMREDQYALMIWRPDGNGVEITSKPCKMPTNQFPAMYKQASETLNEWRKNADDAAPEKKESDDGHAAP